MARPNATAWVDETGVGDGTLFSAERMENIEEAVDAIDVRTAGFRTTVVYETWFLDVGTSEDFTLTVHPGWRAFKVTTEHAIRLRIYDTAAHRTADEARPVTEDPTGDHGLLLEVITTGPMPTITLSPAVDFHSADGSSDFYARADWNGAPDISARVEITFDYIRTE